MTSLQILKGNIGATKVLKHKASHLPKTKKQVVLKPVKDKSKIVTGFVDKERKKFLAVVAWLNCLDKYVKDFGQAEYFY